MELASMCLSVQDLVYDPFTLMRQAAAGDFERIVSAGGFRADSRSFQPLTLGCVTPSIRLRGCGHSDRLTNKTSKQVPEHAKQQTQVRYHESLESQTRIGVSEFWHKVKAVRKSVTRDSRALASSRCTDSQTGVG